MRRIQLASIALVMGSAALGCEVRYAGSASGTIYATEPVAVTATVEPPPVPTVSEDRPPQPSGSALWIDGYHDYRDGSYVWVAGHWEEPPQGRVWQGPVYANGQYYPGYWRQNDRDAPPVYAAPTSRPVYAQPVGGRGGYGQPTYAQPTYAQPVNAQPTYAQPVNAQPTYAQPNGGPAYAQPTGGPAYAQPNGGPAYAQPSGGPAYAQPNGGPAYAQPNGGPAYAQPNGGPAYAQPGRPGYAQPTGAQPTYAQPTGAQPTYAQPGRPGGEPSYARPGAGAQPAAGVGVNPRGGSPVEGNATVTPANGGDRRPGYTGGANPGAFERRSPTMVPVAPGTTTTTTVSAGPERHPQAPTTFNGRPAEATPGAGPRAPGQFAPGAERPVENPGGAPRPTVAPATSTVRGPCPPHCEGDRRPPGVYPRTN